MIKLLILLVVTISAKSEDSQPQSCFPWPDKLLSIRECCNTPFHYNSALLNHCYFGCKSLSLDAFEQNDCASRCYTNYTLLVNDDGELNKNVVKRIYNGNAFNEPKWMKVINETVDFCDYNKSDSLTKSLASFYECVNSKLENSCVKFINTRECDEVEEYFESCKNIQPDCNIWPDDLINPEGCCKTVPLFNREIQQTCRQNCAMKELYIPRQVNCTWRCMFNDSKVHMDGKFDFSVVKFLLIQNSKSNPDWEKPIEIAVEKCEEKLKEMEDSNTRDDMKNKFLLTCLRDVMSEGCADFYDNPNCNKVKRYVKKCPSARSKSQRLFSEMKTRAG